LIRGFLQRLMYGRYGSDRLNLALIIFALIIGLVGSLTHISVILYVSYIPLVYVLFRLLSKNIAARKRENERFLRVTKPLTEGVRNRSLRFRDRKAHKYLSCPACRHTLRVPRGKGKIRITCPKCGERFTKTV